MRVRVSFESRLDGGESSTKRLLHIDVKREDRKRNERRFFTETRLRWWRKDAGRWQE